MLFLLSLLSNVKDTVITTDGVTVIIYPNSCGKTILYHVVNSPFMIMQPLKYRTGKAYLTTHGMFGRGRQVDINVIK